MLKKTAEEQFDPDMFFRKKTSFMLISFPSQYTLTMNHDKDSRTKLIIKKDGTQTEFCEEIPFFFCHFCLFLGREFRTYPTVLYQFLYHFFRARMNKNGKLMHYQSSY